MNVCRLIFTRRWFGWHGMVASAGLWLVGCGGAAPDAVSPLDVDPAVAAAEAMKLYDANGDATLGKDELAKCPPLATALASYDADGDGQLTTTEIASRLTRQYGSGVSLTNVDCTVTLGGQPLSGATVVFRPVAMLGEGVQPAQGVTDELGSTQPAIDNEHLPENLRDEAMMHPGLYHVEITHPTQRLAERYNASTELGCDIGPGSRGGNNIRFALKP